MTPAMRSHQLLVFSRVLTACALGMLLFARPATAQFNGPALPSATGVNHPTPVTTDPALLFPASHNIVLNPGDLISVRVFGPGDYAPTVRLGVDGKAQLPLIGVVSLQGLTITDAETLIADKLLTGGIFRNPQVTIQLLEGPSATISIIGEQHAVLPVNGQRRLLDVLAAGGGLPPSASHIITINRPGVAQPIVVDLGTDPARSALANIPVFAGDTIVVARIGVVYVLGAFKNQGAIPITGNSPLTLLQVASLVGGPNFEGKYDDMRIIRTVGSERTLVKVNIRKVMYGKAPDPVLQADDVIFLPDSMIKSAIKSGGVGVLFSAVSVFINLLTYTRVQ